MISNIGQEYGSLIMSKSIPLGRTDKLWEKLCEKFEESSELSIAVAIDRLLGFTADGLTISKFVADISLLGETIKSLVQTEMTINAYIDLVTKQALLKRLPEAYDSFKTIQRNKTPAPSLEDVCAGILREESALLASLVASPSASAGSVLSVGGAPTKMCTVAGCPRPKGHTASECWIAFPHLKAAHKKKLEASKSAKESKLQTAAVTKASSEEWSSAFTVKACNQVSTMLLPPKYQSSELVVRPFNMDSGCSTTIVNSTDGLSDLDSRTTQQFRLANSEPIVSQGTGIMRGNGKALPVHVVQSFPENLLSMPQLYKSDIATLFHPTYGIMIAKSADMVVQCHKPLGQGRFEEGAFIIDVILGAPAPPINNVVAADSAAADSALSLGIPLAVAPIVPLSSKCILWYKRLGYIGINKLIQGLKHGLFRGVNLPAHISTDDFPISHVEEVSMAKSQAQPHRNLHGQKHSTRPYQFLHVDFKAINVRSWGHAIGSSTIKDDFTNRIFKIPLCNKGEFVPKFKAWVAKFVTSRGHTLSVVRCDNGSEIKNYKARDFLTSIGARFEFTSTYSPASDGHAENANKVILSLGNTLRLAAKLPEAAWAECESTACFLHSLQPNKANPGYASPFEMERNVAPDVSFLRTIGSACYVHKFKPERANALDTRATKGILIGYASETKGYRILVSVSPVHILETMHVTFAEDLTHAATQLISLPDRLGEHWYASYPALDPVVPEFPITAPIMREAVVTTPAPVALENDHIIEHAVAMDQDALDPNAMDQVAMDQAPADVIRHRDIVPVRHIPLARDPYPLRNRINRVRLQQACSLQLPSKLRFSDAIADPHIRDSMVKTITSLYDMKAISLERRLPTDYPIKCRWVHQDKFDVDGKFLRTKSRLCPQGFRFRPGIEYDPDAVSASAPHVNTLFIGLSLEVQRSMFTTTVDADDCFQMHCALPDTTRITLATPDGFYVPDGYVIRMHNALQGSKQSSRLWQDQADAFLLSLNFRQSTSDPSFYFRWNGEVFSQIVRCTDDFRVSSQSKAIRDEIVSKLMAKWPMKIQVNKTWNGMAINHNREEGILQVSMQRDIEDMLVTFGMSECKGVRTPAIPGSKLTKPTQHDPEAAKFPYREAVGALLWLARTGRPDISYAVNQLTKFSTAWGVEHVIAAKRIMRYLKETIQLKRVFRRSVDPRLTFYADADFGGEPEGNESPMCSTSGVVGYLHGIGVIWSSVNLEKTISLSTCEAEYKTLSVAAKATLSIRQFLEEIGFDQDKPVTIFNDNQAAIALSKQAYCSSSTRHMKIKFHFVREQVKDGAIKVTYLETARMVADIMTKALDRVLFERFRQMLLEGMDDEGQLL